MVSVCMATYNGESFIKEQLDSILKQLDPNDEVIVSDDSSDDATVAIVRSFADPRIRILTGNKFHDPIKNFQNCLSYAKGDVIFLSDQDDVWMEGKYAEMKALLLKYDLVISDSVIVDEQLSEIEPSFFRFFGSGKGLIKNIIRSSYYGSCMAFKKSVLLNALPFPDTREIGHDLWIGLVAEITGKVLFYNKPLVLYRRHSASFTVTGLSKSKRSLGQKIRGRAIMVSEVLKFIITKKWKKV